MANVKHFPDRVLDTLKVRNGKARCPAHDDVHASLSATVQDDRCLIFCHSGCESKDVLKAAGLEWSDLFANQEDPAMGLSDHPVAEYEYRDAENNLRYVVERYPNKKFLQRHLTNAGDWIWNMEGVERQIYRLPQVLKGIADNRWIFLVEGEKDVLRLEAEGFVATTTSGGAGSWRDKYASQFRGAKVVIVPDNDEPGRKYAQAAAADLGKTAAQCLILTLPDLFPKGDISDWFARTGTRADLKRLVVLASNEQLPAVTTLDRISRGKVEWFWDQRIPRRKLTVIGGLQGGGKSYLALAILGLASRKGEGALVISYEDDPVDTIRPRAVQLNANLGNLHVWPAMNKPFLVPDQINQLKEYLANHPDITTIVIDPLSMCLGEQSTWQEEIVRSRLSLILQTGLTVIGIMHLAKSDQYSTPLHRFLGSNAFTALARSVLLVENSSVRVIKSNVGTRRDAQHFVIDSQGFRFR